MYEIISVYHEIETTDSVSLLAPELNSFETFKLLYKITPKRPYLFKITVKARHLATFPMIYNILQLSTN